MRQPVARADILIDAPIPIASSDYVFPCEVPSRWFTAACTAAGIKDFTWHSLRHTFASRLVLAGVDLRTVQELMGHRTITTTMRYAHLRLPIRRKRWSVSFLLKSALLKSGFSTGTSAGTR